MFNKKKANAKKEPWVPYVRDYSYAIDMPFGERRYAYEYRDAKKRFEKTIKNTQNMGAS